MKKQKSLTFVAFMLLASLIATSCGGDSPEQTVTSASDSAETTDEVKSDAYPYQITKLDGKELRFLNCVDVHWQGASQIIDYDSYTGESVADAVYKKNREAEEALGIKVTVVKAAVENLHSTISTSVLANDDLYDAVYSCVNSFGTETDGQYVLNLYDIDAINFEDEWWNPSFAESMTIDGDKLYVAVDHMNLNGYTWTDGMYFSKDLVVKLGLDMPYDLVREGKWTLDRMAEYMKPAINLNGDSDFEIDPQGNSIYGLCVQHIGSMMSIA